MKTASQFPAFLFSFTFPYLTTIFLRSARRLVVVPTAALYRELFARRRARGSR